MQPDTFYESPLRRPKLGRVIMLALLLTFLTGACSLSLIFTRQSEGSFGVYLLAVCLSLIVGAPALAIIWFLDRREREPIWIMLAAILWGGVVSTGFALILNALGAGALIQALETNGLIEYLQAQGASQEDIRSILQLPVAIVIGPFVEEILKGAAVLLLLWLLPNEFNGMRDGIIYGALIGWGFNVMETAYYVMNGFVDSGVAPYGSQLISRFVFFGINSHLIYTALTGAGIGLARQSRGVAKKIIFGLSGLTLAILAHMINNGIAVFIIAGMIRLVSDIPLSQFSNLALSTRWVIFALTHLMIESIAYIIIGLGLYNSARWEQKVIQEQLQSEVGSTLTEMEYQLILSEPPFGLRQAPGYDRKTSLAIVDAQNSLAFRKWDAVQRGIDPDTDTLVLAYRARITAMRAATNSI